MELAALFNVGGIGTVAVVGDVDGPEADDAGPGGRVADVATRASRAFNATALIVSYVLPTSAIAKEKIKTIKKIAHLLRSASALAPPGPGNEL